MGNDSLNGGNGNDILAGKDGNDLLQGEAGSDTLDGGMGNDSLNGGNGNDLLSGKDGNDLLQGEAGSDTLDGGMGNDTLDGGNGKDILVGKDGDDLLQGQVGNDTLIGGNGNDTLDAGKGNDLLIATYGEDSLIGGQGKDILISKADAGEPDIARSTDASKVYADQSFDATDDNLLGGQGADIFLFEVLLNAKPEIMAKHANAEGKIDWRGVAGENNNVHDHWVEGVGNDTVLDYDRAAGDKIHIIGHTVDPSLSYATDSNGEDYSIISLVSNQGGAGAHDGDRLGTISVYGDLVAESDLMVQGMAFSAVYQNINEL